MVLGKTLSATSVASAAALPAQTFFIEKEMLKYCATDYIVYTNDIRG
jgi:hypothetical protein